MSNISLQNVSKSFGSKTAVSNISLDIADGEFVVLLGPTGAGKTTVLRLIAGLEKLDQGDILIDGRRVNDEAPSGRDVAFVFQAYSLYPHLSVYEIWRFRCVRPLAKWLKPILMRACRWSLKWCVSTINCKTNRPSFPAVKCSAWP